MEQKDLLQVLKELTLLYYQGELTAEEFHSTKELLLATLRSAHPSWTLDEYALAVLDVPSAEAVVPAQMTSVDNVGEAMGDLLALFEAGDLSEEEYQLTTELLLNHVQQSYDSLSGQHVAAIFDPTVPMLPQLANVVMRSQQDHAKIAAYQSIEVGQTLLQRYHLQQLLGQGATGQVFLCGDTMREGNYALKLIHPHLAHDEQQRQRFMKELHSAERLAHPGIVRTYNLEQDIATGILFYTMEYVEGETLDATLGRADSRGVVPLMPLAWSWQLLAELTHILEYIHARGLVYRDLKPSNIMITPDGYIKLMDFAIAESLEKTAVGPLAAFAGLGYYMAPEQQRGKGEVQPAADVFSMGVLAYQLLTGALPIGRVERPSQLWPALSLRVDDVLLRAMDPKPSRRYPHPRTFWQALSDALSQLHHSAPVPDNIPPLTPYPKHSFDSQSDVPSHSIDPLYAIEHQSVDSFDSHSYGSLSSLPEVQDFMPYEPAHTEHLLELSPPSPQPSPPSPDMDPEEKTATSPEIVAISSEYTFAAKETPTHDLPAAIHHKARFPSTPPPSPTPPTSTSERSKSPTPRPTNDWFSPPVALLPTTHSGDAIHPNTSALPLVNKLAEAPRTPPPRRQTGPVPSLTFDKVIAPPTSTLPITRAKTPAKTSTPAVALDRPNVYEAPDASRLLDTPGSPKTTGHAASLQTLENPIITEPLLALKARKEQGAPENALAAIGESVTFATDAVMDGLLQHSQDWYHVSAEGVSSERLDQEQLALPTQPELEAASAQPEDTEEPIVLDSPTADTHDTETILTLKSTPPSHPHRLRNINIPPAEEPYITLLPKHTPPLPLRDARPAQSLLPKPCQRRYLPHKQHPKKSHWHRPPKKISSWYCTNQSPEHLSNPANLSMLSTLAT